jgi:hypothetical protein
MGEWVRKVAVDGVKVERTSDALLDKISDLVHERDTLLALVALLEARSLQRGDDPARV